MRWPTLGCLITVALAGCDWVFGLAAPLDTPTPPPPEWKSITTGARHTCGIQIDQTLWCWGENARGESAQVDTIVEVLVPAQVGDLRWTAVEAGAAHTCAIDVDANVWCWGANARNAIGANILADHLPLTRVLDGAIAITAGGSHTCAIKSDRSLWCWGRGDEGQLANGRSGLTASEPLPVQVALGHEWSRIDGGLHHTCGITSGQELWCWGENYNQQVLIGGPLDFATDPLQVESETAWTDLALGELHTCAVRSNGTLRCAGSNNNGQLGVTGAPSGSAVDVPAASPTRTWKRVTASVHQTCALRDDGTLWCFGTNAQNQLGLPAMDAVRIPTQTAVDLGALAEITIGASQLCAIDTGGMLWCAGSNGAGQLGDGTGGGKVRPVPLSGSWRIVDVGSKSACARDHLTGSVSCWGNNSSGELADDTKHSRQRPQFVVAGAPDSQLAVGDTHACAQTADQSGTVVCWGRNNLGQLGTGLPTPRELRVVASMFTNPLALVAGTHTCASDNASRVWCWGSNSLGQLGQSGAAPDGNPHATPLEVPVSSSRIAAGLAHGCAVSNADLYCWGDNQFGQLGTVAAGTGPLFVVGGIGAVTLGANHSCAITTSDSLACWGSNSHGQVGDGSTTNGTVPRPIGADRWLNIGLGLRHTCGVRSDRSLWCWGDNARGQLGDGTRIDQQVPTRIGADVDWLYVAAGGEETCALKVGQKLWCWGANGDGQIGDETAWSPTFVRIAP